MALLVELEVLTSRSATRESLPKFRYVGISGKDGTRDQAAQHSSQGRPCPPPPCSASTGSDLSVLNPGDLKASGKEEVDPPPKRPDR